MAAGSHTSRSAATTPTGSDSPVGTDHDVTGLRGRAVVATVVFAAQTLVLIAAAIWTTWASAWTIRRNTRLTRMGVTDKVDNWAIPGLIVSILALILGILAIVAIVRFMTGSEGGRIVGIVIESLYVAGGTVLMLAGVATVFTLGVIPGVFVLFVLFGGPARGTIPDTTATPDRTSRHRTSRVDPDTTA